MQSGAYVKYHADAFTILRWHVVSNRRARVHDDKYFRHFVSTDDESFTMNEIPDEIGSPSVVRAPLRFNGPYPCLALKFPNLSTESQRLRNQTGVSLDFVLDTAANVNTLQGPVAQELQLEKLEDSPALPGVSSSGPMAGGETYMLGDSQLEQAVVVDRETENTDELSANEPFEFMQNLTAAVLPVGNPGSAGLLSLAFFYCFEGGVEFRWGSLGQPQEPKLVDGMMVQSTNLNDLASPSLTFYGENNCDSTSELQRALADLVKVPIDPIPLTQLPSVKIQVNGVEMVALLDTGSPVTVLNDAAAKTAGIETTRSSIDEKNTNESKGGWNPFSAVVDKFKEAQATAEAASKGEILMIGGVDGKPVTLYRSTTGDSPSISVSGISGEDVLFGKGIPVYVGDIPGLAALNGIGVDSPPAVVLGLDVLRRRPRMLFRPRDNEVYF